jgi:uncharacterized protein YbbK (DUF523 family)
MPDQGVKYALAVCPQGVEGGLQIPRVPQMLDNAPALPFGYARLCAVA